MQCGHYYYYQQLYDFRTINVSNNTKFSVEEKFNKKNRGETRRKGVEMGLYGKEEEKFWLKVENLATQMSVCALKARCGKSSYQKLSKIIQTIQSQVVPFLQTNVNVPQYGGQQLDVKREQQFAGTTSPNFPVKYKYPPQNTYMMQEQLNNVMNQYNCNNLQFNCLNNLPISNNNMNFPLNSSNNTGFMSDSPIITVGSSPSSSNPTVITITENGTTSMGMMSDKDDKFSFSTQSFEKNTQKRQKRKRKNKEMDRVCSMCETSDTPEWRRGPLGPRTYVFLKLF